jgi:hypothetical protein
MMFRTLSLSLLLALSCGFANAQQVDDGGVSGTLASASGATPGDPQTIFQVPAENAFALTTVCILRNGEVSGSTFGLIAQGPGCTTYTPGLALPASEEIMCSGPQSENCIVTGVLTSPPSESVE